jgi:aminopeptidase N
VKAAVSLWLAALAPLCPGARLAAAQLPRNYGVEQYEVAITPDLAQKRIAGEVTIHFQSRIDRLDALELDAGDLEIAAVLDGGVRQWFERKGALLIVVLATPARPSEHRSITIRYQAGPAKGLVFFPDQVYASSFASDWMVSNDRPDERAALRLAVAVPDILKVAATGRIDTPAPPYLYGFAAGAFEESTSEVSGVKLRVLGRAAVSEPTGVALRFLAGRTGKPYPGSTYTQVFAHGDAIAEAAGLTLLPESYGQKLSKNPDDLWLLAHELARQWYGVAITCRDWSDCWLGEGLATFLADAFLEQRFGKQRYEREIEHSRQVYETLKADGKDRALSSGDPETLQQAGGDLPTHKGAWFLYQLRRQLTDEVFWRGLRLYTDKYWGRPATSEDFQKSMETAARKSLTKFFDRWVNGCCAK